MKINELMKKVESESERVAKAIIDLEMAKERELANRETAEEKKAVDTAVGDLKPAIQAERQ